MCQLFNFIFASFVVPTLRLMVIELPLKMACAEIVEAIFGFLPGGQKRPMHHYKKKVFENNAVNYVVLTRYFGSQEVHEMFAEFSVASVRKTISPLRIELLLCHSC